MEFAYNQAEFEKIDAEIAASVPQEFGLFDDLISETLDSLHGLPRWVAWKSTDGRKLASNPHTGRNASSTDPTTWAARENAEARARRIGGAVGIVLGPDAPGPCVGGVDLDGCRDPETGEIAPWADEVLERFGTYAEVSPSGTGVKAFFIYDPADLPTFRDHFNAGADWGISFTAGSHLGPEVHLGARWYAVTGQRLPGATAVLRDLPADDLLWLLTDTGPRFKASGGAPARKDGSAVLFSIATRLHRNGADFEVFRAEAMADPDARRHVEKTSGARRQAAVLQRQWLRAGGRVEAAEAEREKALADAIAELDDLTGDDSALARPSSEESAEPPHDWHIAAFDPNGDPDLSDDELALELGRAGWDKDARYCGPLGGWLLWDKARWQPAGGMKHMAIARAFLRHKARLLTEWSDAKAAKLSSQEADKLRAWAKSQTKTLRSDPKIAAVERTARSNPKSLAVPEQFDSDRWLLGTPGGTVDLRTGELREARRRDYMTRITAVAPAPAGTRPEAWLQFLEDVFPGDPEMPAFMQRLAGYALTGNAGLHGSS